MTVTPEFKMTDKMFVLVDPRIVIVSRVGKGPALYIKPEEAAELRVILNDLLPNDQTRREFPSNRDRQRLDQLEEYLMNGDQIAGRPGTFVPDEIQSSVRMLFNEALAGGPNMNGDGGPTLTRNHALDCVWAAKRIAELS